MQRPRDDPAQPSVEFRGSLRIDANDLVIRHHQDGGQAEDGDVIDILGRLVQLGTHRGYQVALDLLAVVTGKPVSVRTPNLVAPRNCSAEGSIPLPWLPNQLVIFFSIKLLPVRRQAIGGLTLPFSLVYVQSPDRFVHKTAVPPRRPEFSGLQVVPSLVT